MYDTDDVTKLAGTAQLNNQSFESRCISAFDKDAIRFLSSLSKKIISQIVNDNDSVESYAPPI